MDEELYNSLMAMIGKLTGEIKDLRSALGASKPVYTNPELMSLLGISTATLKKWRDAGLLGYSQVGDIYLYSKEDVENFLHCTHH